jgi:hypothetical protein
MSVATIIDGLSNDYRFIAPRHVSNPAPSSFRAGIETRHVNSTRSSRVMCATWPNISPYPRPFLFNFAQRFSLAQLWWSPIFRWIVVFLSKAGSIS